MVADAVRGSHRLRRVRQRGVQDVLLNDTRQANAETTVIGDTLTVQWCCRVCNKGWPVTPSDVAARPDLMAVSHHRRVTYRRKIHRPK